MSIYDQIINEQNKINLLKDYIFKEWGINQLDENKVAIFLWKNNNNYVGNLAYKLVNQN